VFLILDDVGVVSSAAYDDIYASERYAPTPNFNRLCEDGVRFENVWVYPTCSPTRAAMLTGKYGFRTGVTQPCFMGLAEIGPDETTFMRLIKAQKPEYSLSSYGKWHLGSSEQLQGAFAPNFMGWDHFSGGLEFGLEDYYNWDNTIDGVTTTATTYATSKNVDDAIAFLNEDGRVQSPFVVWFGFFAPQTLHLPPDDLHSYTQRTGEPDDIAAHQIDYFEAAQEATDNAFQRFKDYLEAEGQLDNTIFIFMGDNGTENNDINGIRLHPRPYDGLPGKFSLAETGLRVPLCVAGTPLERTPHSSQRLVHAVDLYATVLDLVGVTDDGTTDALSFVEELMVADSDDSTALPREILMAEQFFALEADPLGGLEHGLVIRDGRYKFKVTQNRPELTYSPSCFDVVNDFVEENDLFVACPSPDAGPECADALSACAELEQRLNSLVCPAVDPRNPWGDYCDAMGEP
ncbi:MAG: sulfatase-like hydrolase/transferase, partial [Myxococcota bacterium]